ncbi:hypothetical protein [Algiphilus sp.]|uniref:hypothetical protein n=1 Tax=Algiphilus sp. TaxID=1872431 RepID=UPI003B51630F
MPHALRISCTLLAATLLAACATTPDAQDQANATDSEQAERRAMTEEALRADRSRRCPENARDPAAQPRQACPSERSAGPLSAPTSTLEGAINQPLGGLGNATGL